MEEKAKKCIYTFSKTSITDSESSSESEPEENDAKEKDASVWRGNVDSTSTRALKSNWRSQNDASVWRGNVDSTSTRALKSNWRSQNDAPVWRGNIDSTSSGALASTWRKQNDASVWRDVHSTTSGAPVSNWRSKNGKKEDCKGFKQHSSGSSQEKRQDCESSFESKPENSRKLNVVAGGGECNWSIPQERNLQRHRNPSNSESTIESFKGNWCLSAETEKVIGSKESEADTIFKTLKDLHEENPTLFPYYPLSFRSGKGMLTINCYTPDYRDVKNVLNVAKTIRKCIYFPYIMYYYDQKSTCHFIYTLEEELYKRNGNKTWVLINEGDEV